MYAYPRDRFCEYTAPAIKARFEPLTPEAIQQLLSFPVLFAYEGMTHDMRVGYLRRISDRTTSVYIEFEFLSDVDPIPFAKIDPLRLPLDIKDRFELGRTHWAIKDEDLLRILGDAHLLPARSRRAHAPDARLFVRAALEASIFASPGSHGLTDEQLISVGASFGLKRGELLDAAEVACKGGECERAGGRTRLSSGGAEHLYVFTRRPADDLRNPDAMEEVHLFFKELAREVGIKSAVADKETAVRVALATGRFSRGDVDAAIAIFVLAKHLVEEPGGRLRLQPGCERWSMPSEQLAASMIYQRDLPSMRAILDEVRKVIAFLPASDATPQPTAPGTSPILLLSPVAPPSQPSEPPVQQSRSGGPGGLSGPGGLGGPGGPRAPSVPDTKDDPDRAFMRLAIDEARKSQPEDGRPHPRVGAVVARDGRVLGRAHRGERGPGDHGEYTLLEKKLPDEVLVGSTVYVTLEPCTTRNHPKVCCAARLLERKVKRVVIGMVDPDKRISGQGITMLRQGRVEISFFPEDLSAEVEELNRDWIRAIRGAPAAGSNVPTPPPAPPAPSARRDEAPAPEPSAAKAHDTSIFGKSDALMTEAQLRRPGERPAAPPKVDIGILTIRDDEQRAVINVFPDRAGTVQGAHREYTLRHADAGGGERYTVAVVRQVEQGTGEAQTIARDLIDDLAPRLILVVGIAGGLPSDDVTLGDVVLSTRIHDYTVEARKTGHEATYAATGGPIDRALANAVAELANREDELGDWTSSLPARPPVTWTEDGQLYGPPEWQRELRAKLEHHHPKGATPRAPRYMAGPIASSDRLVKDPAVLIPWLQTARNLLAVEMESGGVYRAVRERCPMLAIRGLSDLVGLSRGDPWTKYACASAAAFTGAFLRTRPVPLGATASGPR